MISEFTHEFFEEASNAWKTNKIRVGQASYIYKKDAFLHDPTLPLPPKQTAQSKRATMKELRLRHAIDEYVPPRVRRSLRLRQKGQTTPMKIENLSSKA